MIDERELAINPIVQESVQHNTQVIPHPLSPLQIPTNPYSLTGHIQHPKPQRLPLRHRLGYPGAGVLPRLRLLPARYHRREHAHLLPAGQIPPRALFSESPR